ncbi:MAG: fibrobacter succinogenes major paralogous domain-containing protein [Bacteroidales bacterium]|nr:fibrobacter succinogenes major paralogous domain-containing protein [Bacteroidales bacterium]
MIFFIFLVLTVFRLDGQTNLFVKSGGNDGNSGTSWNTAKATLAGALSSASGTTNIYMMVGKYSCINVTIPNGVTVIGGFSSASSGTDISQRLYPGTNSNWNDPTHCTILSGNFLSRVATVNTGGKLEGCVLRDGRVSGNGGGVLINGGTVQLCVIIRNTAMIETSFTAYGGGAYVQNNGKLLNCVCAYNTANNGPGVSGTNGELTNNTITENISVPDCGTVRDYDGNIYHTVLIGEQCWMRENLRTTHYANGTAIPLGSMTSTTTSYRYYPDDNSANVSTYGYLYNWPAVMNNTLPTNNNPSEVLGVCPTGWHVPSYDEILQMVDYLANITVFQCEDESVGKSMASTTGWAAYSVDCTVGYQPERNNTSGFCAQAAGFFVDAYMPLGQISIYWTATDNSGNGSIAYGLYYDSGYPQLWGIDETYGFSVRCLRD